MVLFDSNVEFVKSTKIYLLISLMYRTKQKTL